MKALFGFVVMVVVATASQPAYAGHDWPYGRSYRSGYRGGYHGGVVGQVLGNGGARDAATGAALGCLFGKCRGKNVAMGAAAGFVFMPAIRGLVGGVSGEPVYQNGAPNYGGGSVYGGSAGEEAAYNAGRARRMEEVQRHREREAYEAGYHGW